MSEWVQMHGMRHWRRLYSLVNHAKSFKFMGSKKIIAHQLSHVIPRQQRALCCTLSCLATVRESSSLTAQTLLRPYDLVRWCKIKHYVLGQQRVLVLQPYGILPIHCAHAYKTSLRLFNFSCDATKKLIPPRQMTQHNLHSRLFSGVLQNTHPPASHTIELARHSNTCTRLLCTSSTYNHPPTNASAAGY